MIKKNITQFTIILLLLGITNAAWAIAAGFYLGSQFGTSNSNNKEAEVETGGTPSSELVTPTTKGFGARIYMGYQFSSYLGLEAAYVYIANSIYKVNGNNNGNPEVHEGGVDVLGKLMLPINKFNMDIFAKGGVAGMMRTQSGRLASSNLNSDTFSKSTNVYAVPEVAIGASYYLNQNWVADITYNKLLSSSSFQSADLITIGIAYHFVDTYCGQFLC